MSKRLYRLAILSARHNRSVILGWVALVGVITFFGITQGGEHSTNADIPGTESQEAFDLLEERFPAQAGTDIQVVLAAPEGETLTSDQYGPQIEEALAELDNAPLVNGVGDEDPAINLDSDINLTEDAGIGFTQVRYAVATDEVHAEEYGAIEEAIAPLRDVGLKVELRGEVVDAHATSESFTAEIVGLVVAMIVLLFAFGSVLAAFTPILSGILGVFTTLMSLQILSNWFSINEFAPILATMIGLAVGIDYALFIVSRHRQFLHEGRSVEDSIARATATSGGAVLFAGMTVVIAISGLAILNIPLLTSMGLASALAVFVSVVLALTLLPAILGLMGHKIDALTLPFIGNKTEEGDDAHETISARWARKVTAKPAPYLAAGVIFMGLLAAPAVAIRLGVPDDSSKSESRTERQAYDLLSEGFGPGVNGPFTVVVDLADVPADQRDAALTEIDGTLMAVDGVESTSPAIPNPEGDTAIVSVTPDTGPDDEETADTLKAIRDQAPAVTASTGADIAVTGLTAVNIDQAEKLLGALPIFLAMVIGLTFILLLVVFRSIVVPIKAALAILISILAALGVVVAVFQWGWGASLIGVEESLPLLPVLPALMFAILFGLSMDYEVFILSRIREEYVHGKDNHDSVNDGLAATARIITAAALIMISVFGSFILSPSIETKMFGVGLATAVLLDATVVRMVMVPSTMILMRDGNWWLPKWLDKRVPHVDIEGAHLDDPEDAPSTDDSSSDREPALS